MTTITTQPITATAEDQALKTKHAAMWASGSYRTVVDDIVGPLGGILVETVNVQPGQRVLDVAAGTGSSALPATRRGAEVTATDLTPELLDVGRAAAAAEGLELTWQTADAEALPYDDGNFDVVISAIGVMFAPHHQQAADELVRVCRPGGTVGVLSWTPEGFIGQVFAVMKPYAPPPPPGAQPPPLWGDEAHVRGLFAPHGLELDFARHEVVLDFPTVDAYMDFFEDKYGPTIMLKQAIEPDRWHEYRARLGELLAGYARTAGRGDVAMEYFVVRGQRG